MVTATLGSVAGSELVDLGPQHAAVPGAEAVVALMEQVAAKGLGQRMERMIRESTPEDRECFFALT